VTRNLKVILGNVHISLSLSHDELVKIAAAN